MTRTPRLSALLAILLAAPGAASAEFVRLRHLRAAGEPTLMGGAKPSFANDEAAARAYIKAVFEKERERNPGLMGPIGEGPNVALERVIDSPATKTRILRFAQLHREAPVFGSVAAVELDADRRLVSVNAVLGAIEGAPAEPKLKPDEAVRAVLKDAKKLSEDPKPARPPRLSYFRTGGKDWRLAYSIEGIAAAPADFDAAKVTGHGLKAPARAARARFNYLVDAQDGSVLLAFSATPLASAAIPAPTRSQGRDDNDEVREFYVSRQGGAYVLEDPLRRIKTYDMGFQPHDKNGGAVVRSTAAVWSGAYASAVSAHANATKIFDFYNDLLKRKGIVDDKTELVSYVNCTSVYQPAPEWYNAEWTGDEMLYGQAKDAGGTLRSLARHTDIVGHELTHGVVQHTADLVYLSQSGALNESMADIMGVLAKNWDQAKQVQDPSAFDWEIGAGLRGLFGGKGPLRDMAAPRRAGQPDHMKDYQVLPPTGSGDWGGVHVNSGIHNKAAYNLLMARDKGGKTVIPWKDAALLYYLALTRLGKMSGFRDMRGALTDVAEEFYRLEPGRDEKLKAIASAYDQVGIKAP
jgi:bacillolysin